MTSVTLAGRIAAAGSARADLVAALRDLGAVAGWAGLLGAGLWLGHGPLGGALGTPAITEPTAWSDWAAAAPPELVTFAALRLVVVVLVWWLVGATLVAVVARLAGWGGLERVVDVLAPDGVRRAAAAIVGIALAVNAVLALPYGRVPDDPVAVQAAAGTRPGGDTRPAWSPVRAVTVLEADVDHGIAGNPPVTPATAPRHPALWEVTAREFDASDGEAHAGAPDPDTSAGAPDPDVDAEVAAGPVDPRPAADAAGATWLVRPGDHLWAIAQQVTGGDEATVETYWRRLVEVNRPGLVDPSNPDLIHPGQVIVLPPEVGP